MSNNLFPVLPGLDWTLMKTPTWSTDIQKSVSGRELRIAYYNIPIYKFTMGYEFLRSGVKAELETLMSFFNQRMGSFDTFIFVDPNDRLVGSASNRIIIGYGDGNQTQFQLLRNFNGYIEPIFVVGNYTIYQGNVLATSGFSVDKYSGIITFNTPPAPGQQLSWYGDFAYRCRFLQDSQDFENFMQNLWLAKKVEFQTVKP
jgi:uncharacterized protein (TIGR02217 family)